MTLGEANELLVPSFLPQMKLVYIPHLSQDSVMSDHSKENTGIEQHESYCPIVRTVENRADNRHCGVIYHFHLNCGLGSPGVPRTHLGGHKVKITFIIILRLYLLLSISFACERRVELSGGYMRCEISTDWMQKQIRKSSWLL